MFSALKCSINHQIYCPSTYMCADSCWCDPSQARDETGGRIGQSDRQVCIPPAPSPWKHKDGRKTKEKNVPQKNHCRKYSISPKTLSSSRCSRWMSEFRSYLPSQCVKHRSMVWRLRKAQVSKGNSMLDGWGMDSHSSVITLAAGSDLPSPANGRTRPVQWRTCDQSQELNVSFALCFKTFVIIFIYFRCFQDQ